MQFICLRDFVGIFSVTGESGNVATEFSLKI